MQSRGDGVVESVVSPIVALTFEQQKELMLLQMERDKLCIEKERLRRSLERGKNCSDKATARAVGHASKVSWSG